jgi:hypothetical protein
MFKWIEFFLCKHVYPNYGPTQDLRFFLIIFFIIIFFFVLNGTKEAQLHVEHTRILHLPRPKIGS